MEPRPLEADKAGRVLQDAVRFANFVVGSFAPYALEVTRAA
jgi:hypothetical protein